MLKKKSKLLSPISSLLTATLVMAIVMTEATNSDINYELFHSRSAQNLTLSHPLPDGRHFMPKTSYSNNGMPSSATSGQLVANPMTETGNTMTDRLID